MPNIDYNICPRCASSNYDEEREYFGRVCIISCKCRECGKHWSKSEK
jgi:hypothetical protein